MNKRLNDSDIEFIKTQIKLAKDVVADEEDPIVKTESFKIVLANLLNKITYSNPMTSQQGFEGLQGGDTPMNAKKNQLAKNCSISLEELNKVLSIHDDSVEIRAPIVGNETFKHVVASQCALIAYEFVLDREWVESGDLIKCLKAMGVKDFSNLAPHLTQRPDIFLTKGTRGHKQYRLTSSTGRESSFQLIRKLAKGENLNES